MHRSEYVEERHRKRDRERAEAFMAGIVSADQARDAKRRKKARGWGGVGGAGWGGEIVREYTTGARVDGRTDRGACGRGLSPT